jgi:hypothetical protein
MDSSATLIIQCTKDTIAVCRAPTQTTQYAANKAYDTDESITSGDVQDCFPSFVLFREIIAEVETQM